MFFLRKILLKTMLQFKMIFKRKFFKVLGKRVQISLSARFICIKKSLMVKKGTIISRYALIDTRSEGLGFISIGEDSVIDEYARLVAKGGKIIIGDDCSVNPYCLFDGAGGIIIGNKVRIAPRVMIFSSNHIYTNRKNPIMKQGHTKKGVFIGDDVWIGANATILDGVKIGTGSVIGAGAVVTKDIKPYTVNVGNPCREIKKRK